jgi:hypothetical protein
VLLAVACAVPHPAPAPPTPEALAGAYVLVSYGGRPLPTREFRAVYHGGSLTLHADGRFLSELDAELCEPDGGCRRSVSRSQGIWLLLHDGTLHLDHEERHSWPAPRIEADGVEIRFYIPGNGMPGFTYRRAGR